MKLKMRDKLLGVENNKTDLAWNPERLRWLVDKSEVATKDIAGATDIKAETLRHYISGYAVPSLSAAVKLADYFQVPVDFLVWRCSERETEDIFENFADYFMNLKNASYSAYLFEKYVGDNEKKEEYLSDWPFNLVEDIFGRKGEECVSFDMVGLEEAVKTLTPKEAEVVELRYRQEKTLREIGEIYGVSRENVRRAQEKALKKLRHPARSRMIRYGRQGVEWMEHLAEREAAIERKEQELKARENFVETAEKGSGIDRNDYLSSPEAVMSGSVRNMRISTRAKNCLARHGCETVGDVIKVAKSGELTGIRNMGWLSSREVLTYLKDEYGVDYFEEYSKYTSQEGQK